MAVTIELTETPVILVGVTLNPLVQFTLLKPIQVVGLVPFSDCDSDECRDIEVCYSNPVFGDSPNKVGSYSNDANTFLFHDSFHAANTSLTFQFILQKLIGNTWTDIEQIAGKYGQTFNFGYFSSHADYTGFLINWGSVLFYKGAGCYRIKALRELTIITTPMRQTNWSRSDITSEPISFAYGLSIRMSNGNYITIGLQGALFTASQLESWLNGLQEVIDNHITFSVYFSGGILHIDANAYASNYVYNISVIPNDDPGNSFTYIDSTYTNNHNQVYTQCSASEPFKLMKWDCNRANQTVRFETWREGSVSDIDTPYLIHDLCGIRWYDSIRVGGFFINQGIKEYNEKAVEWGKPFHGKVEVISDEALNQYEFNSTLLPNYIHKRLQIYGLMGCEVAVSDYNLQNPDYSIKRLLVKKDGNYEPKNFFGGLTRMEVVNVKFARQIQGIIKSACCDNISLVDTSLAGQ